MPEYLLTPLEIPKFTDREVTVGVLLVHTFALEGLVEAANERFDHIRELQALSHGTPGNATLPGRKDSGD